MDSATILFLPPDRFDRLMEVMRRVKPHERGGWQSRLRVWKNQVDESLCAIRLLPRLGQLDDMVFIARAIEQRNIGGWQKHAFDIFEGTHPRFTGLTIRPRPPRRIDAPGP